MRKLYPIFALILLVLLAACGGDDEDDAGVGAASNRQAEETQTAETQPEVVATGWDAAPTVADHLVFAQGSTLYLADFTGTNHQVLLEDIRPPSLALARPQYIAANAGAGHRPDVTLVNLDTQETIAIARGSQQSGNVGTWSPNNEWVTVVSWPNFLVARADGSDSHRIEILDLGAAVVPLWLADNTLLVGVNNPQSNETYMRRYDPATGDDIEIDEDTQNTLLDATANQGPNFLLAVQGIIEDLLGVPVAYPIDPEGPPLITFYAPAPANNFVPEACRTWEVQQQPRDQESESVTLYEAPDTLFLSNLNVLDDNTLIFLRWSLVGCEMNAEQLVAEIVRVDPDGNAQVLTDEVDPGDSLNINFFFGDKGPRIAITSDQRYIAWLGGGFYPGFSTLNITDLATSETVELAREIAAPSFYHEDAFTAVLWAPEE